MIRSFAEIDQTTNIAQVEFKELRTFPDDRGFFRELIRFNDPIFQIARSVSTSFSPSAFAQWSHSKMGKNTVKAWHFHHRQYDWWYLPIGLAHVVLYDNREESPTFKKKIEFKLGETDLDSECLSAVVKIPPGVLHGLKVLSDSAHLFYITSQTYNPDDEGRIPFNSPDVPHQWGDENDLTVAANDRKLHVPSLGRLPA